VKPTAPSRCAGSTRCGTVDAAPPSTSSWRRIAGGTWKGIEVGGPEAFKQVCASLVGSFPDLQIAVESTVAEGDSVVVRWRATGSHRGEGMGYPATQAAVDFRGMTWLVMSGGRIVEGWDAWNQGALVETLRVAHERRAVT